MIKLFVGLGNPGAEYQATRHNAGFWWIDALAREWKLTLARTRRCTGMVARTTMQGRPVWLLKPQTFMNLSGRQWRRWRASTRLQPERNSGGA
jgi:PTH1 family peptidyl-tRNA hydrolase